MNITEDKYRFFPQSWYPVLLSSELSPGQIKEVKAFDAFFIVFRGEDKKARALFSHCPHMGTKFLAGKIKGNHLQCPLHLREFNESGNCMHIPGATDIPKNAHTSSFPVHEEAGIIFVFLGTSPFKFPEFSRVKEKIVFSTPASYVLDTPYQALIFNGFDTHHLGCIHHREILTEPIFNHFENVLTAEYSMGVLVSTFYDWIVKTISSDLNEVYLECFGGNFLIITNKKTKDNILITSVPVTYSKSRIFLTALTENSANNPLGLLAIFARLKITTVLGVSFLKPDIKIIENMRPDFRNFLGTQDKGAAVFWDYWDKLPRDIDFQKRLRN
ncbi:MAG: Rieske (2Fe-2S) protein [Bacteriovorax sp.]|jgi:phenylpropionate dioxygenase-like ring-hydroxylating dioxygenase large terminal subunit